MHQGEIAPLDELSCGRVLLGMGRGLARREHEGFGISMDESRERVRESLGREPEAPVCCDFTLCDPDPGRAEVMAEMYLDVQAWGTPDQVLEKLDARREVIGDFDLTACFRYAGLNFEDAKSSMTCFGENVIPVLRQRAAAA